MTSRHNPRRAINSRNNAVGSVETPSGRRSARLLTKRSAALAPEVVQPPRRRRAAVSSPSPSPSESSHEESNSSPSVEVITLSSGRPSIDRSIPSRSASVEAVTPVRDFRPASSLINLGPPPPQRRRIEEQQDTYVASNASIAEALGISVREYEEALRAEQAMFNRTQQIQRDEALAARLARDPDNFDEVLFQFDPPVPPVQNVATPSARVPPVSSFQRVTTDSERSPVAPPVQNVADTSSSSTVAPNTSMTPSSSTMETNAENEEVNACTICFEDVPRKPFTCKFCSQIVGCYACVQRWFSNMKKNKQPCTCPLCRHAWSNLDAAQKKEAPAPIKKKAAKSTSAKRGNAKA